MAWFALYLFIAAAGLWVAAIVQLAWEIVQWMWAMDESKEGAP